MSNGNVELTRSNLAAVKTDLTCNNINVRVLDSITLRSNKSTPDLIPAGTRIATVNGIQFSVSEDTSLRANAETDVPVHMNGRPLTEGNFSQVISINKVSNPNNFRVHLCVVDRSEIRNPDLEDAVGSDFQEFNNLLCLLKNATSPQEKTNHYTALKAMAQNLSAKIRSLGQCDPITTLQEVCWLNEEKHEYNLTIPGQAAVEQEQQDMVDANERTIQPIWRPNTSYYMRFRLKDEVDNGARVGEYDYYYGFKTVGPVGHYHKHNEVNYVPAGENPDQYPLTSLREYIDYNRSYPNADGSLLQAKPLYYGNNQCKINIYFTKPMTYHMLSGWPLYNGLDPIAGNMHMAIKDPASDVIIPYPLPVDFDTTSVPGGQTLATWLEVDWTELANSDDIEVPVELEVIGSDGVSLGIFSVLFSELGAVTNRQHIRIGDEAALADNSLLTGGTIQWEANGTTISYTILETGTEDATWNVDNDPRIPINLQMLNNMVDHVNANSEVIKCELKIGKPIVPNSYSYNVTVTNLKPSKLYTALMYNAFDTNGTGNLEDSQSEEVHQFVFQTSRYENFASQVQSYWLREIADDGTLVSERQAVFNLPVDVSTDEIEAAYSIVNDSPNSQAEALQLQYFDLFDRATEAILGIKPLDPPQNTEFNLVKDAEDIIAVLIRSPEPFNIPRIPLEEIQETIKVVFGTGSVNNAYKVLYSKDYSQALIMHSSKKITASTLNFRFQLKNWNGSAYVVSDTETIENLQLT